MILIVEGIEGVGKTTLSKALSERLGWPIFKSLQPLKKGTRWSTAEMVKWGEAGVPVQTCAEDLYNMDVLAALEESGQKVNLIMDRSMFSGLAYSLKKMEQLEWLYSQWEILALKAEVKVISLKCDIETSSRRINARQDDVRGSVWRLIELDKKLNHWLDLWNRTQEIHTFQTEGDVNATREQVLAKLGL